MSTEPPLVDQRLQLLQRHWKRNPLWQHAPALRPQRSRRFTIAVSREAGSPGLEIGRAIAERLNWPVYEREVVDLIAQQSGLRSELLESVDEHDRNWLVDALEAFSRRERVSTAEFVHHLVHVLTALAAHGSCVIVGRGATSCLPRATTLRLRVVADLGERVQRLAAELHVSEDKALSFVQRIDRDRAQFVARHFHRDVHDVHNFDLVLNASRLTASACADAAVQALRDLEHAAAAVSQEPARQGAAAAS
jgi:cytidylate kinase